MREAGCTIGASRVRSVLYHCPVSFYRPDTRLAYGTKRTEAQAPARPPAPVMFGSRCLHGTASAYGFGLEAVSQSLDRGHREGVAE